MNLLIKDDFWNTLQKNIGDEKVVTAAKKNAVVYRPDSSTTLADPLRPHQKDFKAQLDKIIKELSKKASSDFKKTPAGQKITDIRKANDKLAASVGVVDKSKADAEKAKARQQAAGESATDVDDDDEDDSYDDDDGGLVSSEDVKAVEEQEQDSGDSEGDDPDYNEQQPTRVQEYTDANIGEYSGITDAKTLVKKITSDVNVILNNLEAYYKKDAFKKIHDYFNESLGQSAGSDLGSIYKSIIRNVDQKGDNIDENGGTDGIAKQFLALLQGIDNAEGNLGSVTRSKAFKDFRKHIITLNEFSQVANETEGDYFTDFFHLNELVDEAFQGIDNFLTKKSPLKITLGQFSLASSEKGLEFSGGGEKKIVNKDSIKQAGLAVDKLMQMVASAEKLDPTAKKEIGVLLKGVKDSKDAGYSILKEMASHFYKGVENGKYDNATQEKSQAFEEINALYGKNNKLSSAFKHIANAVGNFSQDVTDIINTSLEIDDTGNPTITITQRSDGGYSITLSRNGERKSYDANDITEEDIVEKLRNPNGLMDIYKKVLRKDIQRGVSRGVPLANSPHRDSKYFEDLTGDIVEEKKQLKVKASANISVSNVHGDPYYDEDPLGRFTVQATISDTASNTSVNLHVDFVGTGNDFKIQNVQMASGDKKLFIQSKEKLMNRSGRFGDFDRQNLEGISQKSEQEQDRIFSEIADFYSRFIISSLSAGVHGEEATPQADAPGEEGAAPVAKGISEEEAQALYKELINIVKKSNKSGARHTPAEKKRMSEIYKALGPHAAKFIKKPLIGEGGEGIDYTKEKERLLAVDKEIRELPSDERAKFRKEIKRLTKILKFHWEDLTEEERVQLDDQIKSLTKYVATRMGKEESLLDIDLNAESNRINELLVDQSASNADQMEQAVKSTLKYDTKSDIARYLDNAKKNMTKNDRLAGEVRKHYPWFMELIGL